MDHPRLDPEHGGGEPPCFFQLQILLGLKRENPGPPKLEILPGLGRSFQAKTKPIIKMDIAAQNILQRGRNPYKGARGWIHYGMTWQRKKRFLSFRASCSFDFRTGLTYCLPSDIIFRVDGGEGIGCRLSPFFYLILIFSLSLPSGLISPVACSARKSTFKIAYKEICLSTDGVVCFKLNHIILTMAEDSDRSVRIYSVVIRCRTGTDKGWLSRPATPLSAGEHPSEKGPGGSGLG